MSKKKSENEPAKKSSVKPESQPDILGLIDQHEDKPSADWDLENLTGYVTHQQDRLNALQKRTTVEVFRCGHALSLAKPLVESSEITWSEYLKQLGIKSTTAWEAIVLYENAGSEDNVKNMTLTQAKVQFSVVKAKNRKVAKESPPEKEIISITGQLMKMRALALNIQTIELGSDKPDQVSKLIQELIDLLGAVEGKVNSNAA